MTSPTPPAGDPAGTPPPALPDLSDLIADPGKPPRESRTLSGATPRLYAAGAVAALVLAGGGYVVGHVTTHSGPATLTAAVQEAQAGKLPCGTPPANTGGGGATAGGFARGGGAGFIVARLCQTGSGTGAGSGAAGGSGTPGAGFAGRGGAGGLGGLFGPGSVNGTISSISGNTLSLQTRGGTVTITLPSSAKVTKTTAGALSDLANGANVVVTTSQDASGNRTATSIFLLPVTGSGGATN